VCGTTKKSLLKRLVSTLEPDAVVTRSSKAPGLVSTLDPVMCYPGFSSLCFQMGQLVPLLRGEEAHRVQRAKIRRLPLGVGGAAGGRRGAFPASAGRAVSQELPRRGAEDLHAVGRCTLTPPDPYLKGAWYPGGLNPCTYQVKTRFQDLPFKCNLHRYNAAVSRVRAHLPLALPADLHPRG
jgi:hypothetical protein